MYMHWKPRVGKYSIERKVTFLFVFALHITYIEFSTWSVTIYKHTSICIIAVRLLTSSIFQNLKIAEAKQKAISWLILSKADSKVQRQILDHIEKVVPQWENGNNRRLEAL